MQIGEELLEVLKCCFKLNDTDVNVLEELIKLGRADGEVIASELNVSKTTVDNSLKKLMALGLVLREKVQEKKIGRPKYVFYLSPQFSQVVKEKIENCSKKFSQVIK